MANNVKEAVLEYLYSKLPTGKGAVKELLANYSNREVASLMGVHPDYPSKWRNGSRQPGAESQRIARQILENDDDYLRKLARQHADVQIKATGQFKIGDDGRADKERTVNHPMSPKGAREFFDKVLSGDIGGAVSSFVGDFSNYPDDEVYGYISDMEIFDADFY